MWIEVILGREYGGWEGEEGGGAGGWGALRFFLGGAAAFVAKADKESEKLIVGRDRD